MYNNHPESNTNYSINDSIYKSKLIFYNSYKILHKDIDEELEKNNSYNIMDEENHKININNVFQNIKKASMNKEQKGL